MVLRTSHTTHDRGECDAEFFIHVMLMEDAWNNDETLEVTEFMQFMTGCGLHPEAVTKLTLLPLSLIGFVVRNFHPQGNPTTWSKSFVAHADSIERAWSHRAVDAYRAKSAPSSKLCVATLQVSSHVTSAASGAQRAFEATITGAASRTRSSTITLTSGERV